jgi:hypothetical protein
VETRKNSIKTAFFCDFSVIDREVIAGLDSNQTWLRKSAAE